VALFLRRATEADREFTVTAANLAAAARIARRVDGLPLALELAAGRLRTLPAPELAEQLERGLGLLATGGHRADPRHTAVTATLDWSYRLLSVAEQRLLTRLSVFRGGFTAEAAAGVCGPEPPVAEQVVTTLAALVDRSLVQPYHQQQPRYRLLEVVREDAARRLAESGDAGAVADRHLDYWLAHARSVAARPALDDQIAGWVALRPELDNLRAANDHAYAGGRTPEAVELTTLLFDFWALQDNRLAEAGRWFARAEPHLADCPPQLRGLVLFQRGQVRIGREDYRGGHALICSALADIAPHQPLHYVEAQIGAVRSAVRLLRPDSLAQARELFATTSRADDPYLVLHGTVMLAEALAVWGRYAEAVQLCRRFAPLAGTASAGNAVRYLSVRCLAELGHGDPAAATRTADRLRDRLDQPDNYLLRALPSRVLALHALATRPAGHARATITGLVGELDRQHPPTTSPAYALRFLLAEAQRRTGHLDQARQALAHGLAEATERSDYSVTLPAVAGAALLAADLGEPAAARELAGGWERVRRQLGLPAPLGYADQVAAELGLDPRPGRLVAGAAADQAALPDLVRSARRWFPPAAEGPAAARSGFA
jgi:ATP/maltotriose-dependent transcriptional regulator MalT